jgi:hypothetical protein
LKTVARQTELYYGEELVAVFFQSAELIKIAVGESK